MSIEYTMQEDGDFLFVQTRGYDESLRDAKDYNDAVLGRAKAIGCTKILCDERELEYRLSLAETYRLGEYTSKVVDHFTRIAIVPGKDHQDVIDFWENVTNNRGVTAKVFHSVEQARAWLE